MELFSTSPTKKLNEHHSKIINKGRPTSAIKFDPRTFSDLSVGVSTSPSVNRCHNNDDMSPYSSVSLVAAFRRPTNTVSLVHAGEMLLPPISTLKRPTSSTPFLATATPWSGREETSSTSWTAGHRVESRDITSNEDWSGLCDGRSRTVGIERRRPSPQLHDTPSSDIPATAGSADCKVESYSWKTLNDRDDATVDITLERFRCQRTHHPRSETPTTTNVNVSGDSASAIGGTSTQSSQQREKSSQTRAIGMTADVIKNSSVEDILSRDQRPAWSDDDRFLSLDSTHYTWNSPHFYAVNNLPPISINVSCFPCGLTTSPESGQQLPLTSTSSSSCRTTSDLLVQVHDTLMPPGSCSALSSCASVNSLSPIPYVPSSLGRNSRRKRALSVSPLSNTDGFDLNAIIRTSPTSLVIAPSYNDPRSSPAGSMSPSSSLHGNYGHVSIARKTMPDGGDLNASRTREETFDVCQSAQSLEQLGTTMSEQGTFFGQAFDNHLVMHQDALQQWEQRLFSSEFVRGNLIGNDSIDFPEVNLVTTATTTIRDAEDMLFINHLELDDGVDLNDSLNQCPQLPHAVVYNDHLQTMTRRTFHEDQFDEERFQMEDFVGFSEFNNDALDCLKYESKDDDEEDVDTASSSSSSSSSNEGGPTSISVKGSESVDATATTTLTVDDNRCRWIDCSAVCCDRDDLVRHIERAHVDQRKGPEDFTCFWQGCPRRHRPFNARYKLLIHMRVHSGEKPNKCTFKGCGKAFSRLENLKIHLRSHTGERPYTCQHLGCVKAFSNSSDRAKHQRTHVDTKPYACQMPGCSKRYTDPSSLRKHVKNHVVKEQKIRKKIRGIQAEDQCINHSANLSSSDHFYGLMDAPYSSLSRSSGGGSGSTQSNSNRESPTTLFGQGYQPNVVQTNEHNWADCDPFDACFSMSPKSEVSDVESQFLRDAILFNNEYNDLCVDEFFNALDAGTKRQVKVPRSLEQDDDLACKLTTVYANIL